MLYQLTSAWTIFQMVQDRYEQFNCECATDQTLKDFEYVHANVVPKIRTAHTTGMMAPPGASFAPYIAKKNKINVIDLKI